MPLNEWHDATYIYDFTAKITKPHGKEITEGTEYFGTDHCIMGFIDNFSI